MQFKAEKQLLVTILQNLISIVPTKTTLQILTNFLISLKGDMLSVSATDLDITMKTTLAVKGEKDGELTINARKLYEIARELPEGPVSVLCSNNVMQIKAGKNFTCKIAGADTTDFPAAPSIDAALEFSLPAFALATLAGKTAFAVSLDETRQCLNGILWDIRPKEMRMVATDGHKLGYCAYKHQLEVKEGRNVILPPKAMNHLCRIIAESDVKDVRVVIGATYVSFAANDSTVTTKLIDGPYPNYDQVIPKGNNKRASIDKNELAAALRRVSILSSGKTHQVKFSFSNNLLEISSVNRDFGGEAAEQIPVTFSAEGLDIGFNAAFFMDILRLTDSPRVRLSLNSAISACLFHPENEDKPVEDYFFLLMPLRLLDK